MSAQILLCKQVFADIWPWFVDLPLKEVLNEEVPDPKQKLACPSPFQAYKSINVTMVVTIDTSVNEPTLKLVLGLVWQQ